MIAVDTNVLVRILTNDDPVQAKRAIALVKTATVFVPKTVLLETEWVLRHAYEVERTLIEDAFRSLAAVPGVVIEDREAVLRAFDWHGKGMDLADALHLASAQGASSFATFDRDLAKAARRSGALPGAVVV